MTYCYFPENRRCSNRDKCKAKKCSNINTCEPPERDIQQRSKHQPQEINFNNLSSSPPPEPPNGDWDLQYCQWQGWTWVKKSDKNTVSRPQTPQGRGAPVLQFQERQQKQNREDDQKSTEDKESPKKKNGGLFGCFKKKPKEKPLPKSPPPPPRPPPEKSYYEKSAPRRSRFDDFDDYYCCCPCDHCCCCCGDYQEVVDEPRRTVFKNTETQTCVCEVKEQATKTSESDVSPAVPSRTLPRPRCKGRRPMCCRCMHSVCCPCSQNSCCPCERSRTTKNTTGNQTKKEESNQNENIVNYCLTRNLRKPTALDHLNMKTDYSAVHKSLDILLKNNINIIGLFRDKRDWTDTKPKTCLSSENTISFLSNDNLTQRTGQEHCNLLTAVCDAILSSHKFDDDKFSSSVRPVQEISSESSQRQCETKDSCNVFSSRSFLQKILSDLTFPTLTKSSENVNNREIGVQVDKKPLRRIETKKSLTKLVRNKSRNLTSRYPRKVESLRKTLDLIRLGYYDKCSKYRRPRKESDHKLTSAQASTSKQDPSLNIETIEKLLNSFDFLHSSTSKTGQNENSESLHLLDTTSAPFTDLDLLLTLENHDQETKEEE